MTVEDQGRLEVGPEIPLVRVGDDPVEDPDPAQMDEGEKPGDHDGEDRHGLGAPGDGRPPLRPEEIEDGGDQGARMGDPDPEDEIDEVDAPHDRDG